MIHKESSPPAGWLLFFYSVPSKPVSNRMKVWRRLMGAGAVQLKGAVYVLPFTEEHYELLQWLTAEVASMGGEAAFVKVERVETVDDAELVELFNRQREREHHGLGKKLDETERRLNSIKKGTRSQDIKSVAAHLGRILKDFETVEAIDFFSSAAGEALRERLDALTREISSLGHADMKRPPQAGITRKRIEDYRKRVWTTRQRPFVDRMASAWLIRKFIDRDAVFTFIGEKARGGLAPGAVAFDIQGGEFTHSGDLCTFEVLLKSFGLKDKVLRKIAALVHELDTKDGKYRTPEAKGVEELLSGIRKTAKDDAEALEKGIALFEMLYASKSG